MTHLGIANEPFANYNASERHIRDYFPFGIVFNRAENFQISRPNLWVRLKKRYENHYLPLARAAKAGWQHNARSSLPPSPFCAPRHCFEDRPF